MEDRGRTLSTVAQKANQFIWKSQQVAGVKRATTGVDAALGQHSICIAQEAVAVAMACALGVVHVVDNVEVVALSQQEGHVPKDRCGGGRG